MKFCYDCSLEKPLSEWNLASHKKDGLQTVCRSCQAIRRAVGRREENVAERARIKERDRSLAAQGKHFCLDCKVDKSIEEFYLNKQGRRGLQSICIPCNKTRTLAWRVAHPDNTKRTCRKTRLKCKYGMSVEAFERLIIAQDGKCKICLEVFGDGIHARNVDHDHLTGEIRGILCPQCNTGLGLFKDSPSRLIAAAAYLQKDALTPGPS